MRERLLEDLLWFLERPSVTGEEKLLCDDLEARISRLPGWKVERVSNNLVVRRDDPDAYRDGIVFAGHLDTVPEPEGGLPVRVEGEKIYGRGASDMKAGDAVMLTLLEGFPWENSWVEVTFRGRSAHSARPWQGENAITAAGEFLAELHERQVEEVVVEGLTFYEVLVPTMARGGRAKNVVPGEFWINVNCRFAPGKDQRDVRRVFEELLGKSSAEYEIADYAPSGSVELDNPLLRRLVETGLEVKPKQAWTDVARFAERGVVAANFGPGLPSQAHQEAEFAELPLLERCYERLGSFLKHN